eukprot:2952204-Amphidinium_carterae.1
MSVKLPMPTQSDGRNPQFREWSGEVKADLMIHNVHIEDYMDQSAKSIDAIDLRNIQDAYVAEDVQYRDNLSSMTNRQRNRQMSMRSTMT